MLTGSNGILTQAQNAKNKTEQSGEEEKVKLAVVAAKTDGYGEIKEEDLTDELIKYFENESNFNIEPSKNENSYLITITESERSYYVEENGNVIGNLYIIRDLDNLENFRDEVNKGNTFEGKTVVLLSDIELQGNWEPIGQIGEGVDENWAGTGTNYFKGDFYGMGHTISNMTLNYEELNSGYNDLGFFSKNYGKIYDLNVECDIDAKVVGNGNLLFAGAISGFSHGDIQNCKASGTIDVSSNNDGSVRIGGLVGQCNDGNIFNCSNETIINTNQTSQTQCGGIIGYIDTVVNIEKCFNSGKITINNTSGKIGGIIGFSGAKGMLKNSYNIGDLTAENCEDLLIGGIAGQPYSGGNEINFTIKNVYNNATISITKNSESESDVGGIVGACRITLSIENAFNMGNIEVNDSNNSVIGGIIGQNEGIINNVYNSGNINNSKSGNIVGFNVLSGNITNAYYNTTGKACYMNQGKIDSESVMYKEELPTILNVINSDNAFKEGEDENPIFNE